MAYLLRKALIGVASILLIAMVAALFLQVLAREFRWPVDWTEEMSRFAFIAMTFLAAAYNTLTRSHLRVTVFADQLAKVIGQRSIDFIHAIILAGFAGLMTVYSWLNLTDGIRYPNISPAMGFNQNYLFTAMCLGFALICLLHLKDLSDLVRKGQLDE